MVTRGKQYKEAVARMRNLKLMKNVHNDFREGTLNKSEKMGIHSGLLYWLSKEEKDFVSKWEEKSGNLAYHIIKDETQIGIMHSILFVSKHEEEWQMDKDDLDNQCALAYCVIGLDESYGEYGSIGVNSVNGGLRRTY